MLLDELKKRLTQAMKERDEVTRDVLRVALGEIQTAEARASRTLSEEEAIAIVRKLVKSNDETIAAAGSGERADTLKRENAVLTTLLPATLGVDQIALALAPVRDAILAAKSDGQATGIAMKHLKSTGAAFDGNDAAAAVRKVRAPS